MNRGFYVLLMFMVLRHDAKQQAVGAYSRHKVHLLELSPCPSILSILAPGTALLSQTDLTTLWAGYGSIYRLSLRNNPQTLYDFQYVGHGFGAVDLVYFLATSVGLCHSEMIDWQRYYYGEVVTVRVRE
ncbi:hypothetical protein EV426DRAFT_622935 [Tirmania nivea]|nr:hypothetical protein EV426DRAFT_622935 [Tirmania nivea]